MLRPTYTLALLLNLVTILTAEQQQASVSDIPRIGFGTWNLDRSNASEAVVAAFKAGYRHIDCAAIYGNEKEVGRGIKDGAEAAGAKREEFWITSKLWNDRHRPDLVPQALDDTLADLGLEYLDLYLMHWPVGSEDGETSIDYIDTWKAMIKLLATGKTRHVGVSNFSPAQMEAIIPIAKPYAHQFETHPYLQQTDFVAFHKKQGIHVTAYSPLGNQNPVYTSWRKQVSGTKVPQLLDNPVVKDIARERGCTPAQVALKWGMMRGTSVIPKSQKAERIAENYGSLECRLELEDWRRVERSMPIKRFNNPSGSWGVMLYEGLPDGASGVVDAVKDGAASWIGRVSSSLEKVWKRSTGQHREL